MVNGVPGGMMNTYCWIHGTFTIPSQLTGVKLGEDVPHPGVAPKSNRNRNEEEPGHVRLGSSILTFSEKNFDP